MSRDAASVVLCVSFEMSNALAPTHLGFTLTKRSMRGSSRARTTEYSTLEANGTAKTGIPSTISRARSSHTLPWQHSSRTPRLKHFGNSHPLSPAFEEEEQRARPFGDTQRMPIPFQAG